VRELGVGAVAAVKKSEAGVSGERFARDAASTLVAVSLVAVDFGVGLGG
jgi:hypothetical protein